MLIENRPSLSADQVEILSSSLCEVLVQLGEMKEIVRSNQATIDGFLYAQTNANNTQQVVQPEVISDSALESA